MGSSQRGSHGGSQLNNRLTYWATQVSDIHGLKHIAGSGGVLRRLIWLVVLMGFLAFLIFLCFSVFKRFLNFAHVTQVDVEYTARINFPAVTICNFNKYRESAFTEYDLKNVGIHLGLIDEDHNLINPELYTEEFRHFVHGVNWTDVHEDPDYNITDFTVRTGHQLEDMIVSCIWHGTECDHNDFSQVLTHLGACYTFNYHPYSHNESTWSHSLRAGAANGLHLILDIETPEYTPSNDLDAGGMDAGLRMMIHHPTEPPYPKELGFSVSAGDHTSVSMHRVRISSLSRPYTECEDGTRNNLTVHFDHYSLEACRIEWETLVVTTECGCRLPEQPEFDGYPVCSPDVTHECAHEMLTHFMDGSLESNYTSNCLSPCNVESYPSSLSMAKLRPLFIEKLFANTSKNMTAEYIRDNVAVVTIYYEAINYETITMMPEYNIATFFAVVGGNMGLCLGASFLSIVQLGEFILDEFMVRFCLGCKSTNNNSSKRQRDKNQNVNGTQTEQRANSTRRQVSSSRNWENGGGDGLGNVETIREG